MVIWARIVLLALLSISVGCASLAGRTVPSGKLSTAESAKGVTYYLPKPTISILRKGLANGKKADPQYELTIGSVADESKRFEVGMSQGLFTSDTFDLKMGPGQTVASLNSKRTDEIGPTFASLIGVGAATFPMVAKAFLLKDGETYPDELLLSQILGHEKAMVYNNNRTYLRDNAASSSGDASYETRLNSWKVDNATIREVLIEKGRSSPEPGQEIKKIGDLLALIVKGYAYPKTAATDTPSDADLSDAKAKILLYEPLLTRIEDGEDEIDKARKDTTKSIQTIFASLQAKVHQELLPLIRGTTTDKAALNQALATLQGAIALIVNAKDPLDRNLLSRKRVLTEFLSRPLTKHADEDEANAYQKLSDEFTKVVTAMSFLLDGGTPQPGDPLPLGTDVTSRIDKNIFYMRPVQSGMNDIDMQKQQVPVARAIIKYFGYEAVIVVN